MRVLIAQNCLDEALALLAKLEQLHQSIGRQRLVMEALIWQAVIYELKNKHRQAVTQLQCAMHMAEPEGYIRIFLDAGQPVADVLAQLPLLQI